MTISSFDISDDNSDGYGTRIRILEGTKIYQSPDRSTNSIGYLEETSIVEYYETRTIDGISWYRIGSEEWIANSGNNFKLYTD